jgi:hypothetical protein
MADVDYSGPEHRLDNLQNMRFVRAYARVRHQVYKRADEDFLGAFLRGYMESLEHNIAEEMQLPETTLVGRLVDLGRDLCEFNDGQDQAE